MTQPNADIPTGANQLADVIELAAEDGFSVEFVVADEPSSGDDALRCPRCETDSPADSFVRTWTERLEGASDPADMLHVSALTCPNCSARGLFIAPFGPSATERQAAVLRALPEPRRESPPSSS